MKSISLLDCTLRDGGFVNDWNFGFGSIKSIISRLDCAGVDIIEVGFIDDRRKYDENRSIFPDSNAVLPVFQNIEPSAAIVGMIDYGTCAINKITSEDESCLDGIRVIFKKNDQDGALEYLAELKAKGYKIFVNPVSVTSYSDNDVAVLIEKINKIRPYAVSVVDTYGLMHSRELLHYFSLFDKHLGKDIILGYHAHNNFQMAYANSIAVINSDISRPVFIDASLFGMGKSAGNACTELVAMYMNDFCGREFDISQLQEAIDVDIQKEYRKKYWGYNFEYYIAALNECHPTYVRFFIDKRCLSVKSVNILLKKIPDAKKLSFDKELAEDIFEEYQNKSCDDSVPAALLRESFRDKPVLLIGPGKTLQTRNDEIAEFIRYNHPVTVSVNFLNGQFPVDYVFMGNAKRYSQFFHRIHKKDPGFKIICSSNITEAGRKIDYTVNYSALLSENNAVRDNPLIMFMRLLKNIGVSEVILAGFDGYAQDNSENYYDDYVRFLYCDDDVLLRNEAIRDELRGLSKAMTIRSLTPTRYL